MQPTWSRKSEHKVKNKTVLVTAKPLLSWQGIFYLIIFIIVIIFIILYYIILYLYLYFILLLFLFLF